MKPPKTKIAQTIQSRLSSRKEAGLRPVFESPVKFGKTEDDGVRTIEMIGNSGTPFNYAGEEIVVDFSRTTTGKNAPILRDHDPSRILGHSTKVTKDLRVSGVLSGDEEEVAKVTGPGDRGYPWQASIYLDTEGYEAYDSDHKDKIKVNGREYKAPLTVVWGHIREFTVTSLGADEHTSSAFFSWNPTMADDLDLNVEDEFDDLELDATDEDELDEFEFDADEDELILDLVDIEDEIEDSVIATRVTTGKYITKIEKVAAAYSASEADIEKALTARLTPDQFELALLRRSRPKNEGHRPAKDAMNSDNFSRLEAAIYLSLGKTDKDLERMNVRRAPNAETFQKAEDEYGYEGLGLQQLLLEAAHLNGHRGREFSRLNKSQSSVRNVLKAAFSTHELSGILSNVQNTLVRGAFMATEQAWRRVAKIGRLDDFKTHTRYALTGDLTYEKLGPTGEIKHGTFGEQSWSVSLETWAKMFSLTFKDIVNDDLGALAQLNARLGRGAGLAINDHFWTVFMNNSSFFTTARGNYQEGATTDLSVTSLTAADVLIGAYTDPDGKPYPVTMDRLLVPRALRTLSSQISRDTTLAYGADDESLVHNSNPWAGRFEVIDSVYLQNSSFTGNSNVAWYLLGNPDDLHVIELNFLNGRTEPTIESTDVDFDQLGIQTRGYFHFGADLAEYRAGFKSKGEA